MWFCARSRSQPTMPRLGLFFCLLVLHCDLLLHCCLECLYCAFFVAFVSFRKAPKPSESSVKGSTTMLRLVVSLCLHLLLACFALRFTFALLLGMFVLCFFCCVCFFQKSAKAKRKFSQGVDHNAKVGCFVMSAFVACLFCIAIYFCIVAWNFCIVLFSLRLFLAEKKR